MPRTPPRLDVTIGPQAMSRLKLARREGEGAGNVDALLFGRAIDAGVRGDSEWFLRDYPAHANPMLSIAEALSELLRPMGDAFQTLSSKFTSRDPVEVSVGLETIQRWLVGGDADQEAVLKAVTLASELSASLREDPGLTDGAACRVLTYAALEAYYYGRATSKAKRRFDADRGLIRCATGLVESSINQDEDIGIGLSVWEGWQAIRSLRTLFSLGDLAVELERKKQLILAGMLFCADVIVRMGERPIDVDAVLRSIVAVERIAEKDRRKLDASHTEAIRAELEEIVRNQEADGSTRQTPVVEHREARTPDRRAEQAFRARTDHDDMVPPKRREPVAVIEDLTSVIERLEILLEGDDNSLVFEVAPMLLRAMRLLYAELSAHHGPLREAIYSNEPKASREVQALRALVARGAGLVEKHDALRTALRTGEIDIGYHTEEMAFDDVTDPDLPRDPLEHVQIAGAEVRAVRSSERSLELELEVAIEGTRHRMKLRVDAARMVWHRIDLSGGASLGTVEKFERDGARVRIAGAWGDVELSGAELQIALEG
jgi:hypothetical protein